MYYKIESLVSINFASVSTNRFIQTLGVVCDLFTKQICSSLFLELLQIDTHSCLSTIALHIALFRTSLTRPIKM